MKRRNIVISVIIGLLVLTIAGSVFAFPRQNQSVPSKNPVQTPNMPVAPRYGYQNPNAPTSPMFGRGRRFEIPGLGPLNTFGRPFNSEINKELIEAKMKLTFAEALNAMNLDKEQAEKIYDVLNEAKEELQEINDKIVKEYNIAVDAVVNKDDETLEKAKEKIQSLIEEKKDLIEETFEKVKSEITVEQLEKLMNYFAQEMKSKFENRFGAFKNKLENLPPQAKKKLKENIRNRFKNFSAILKDSNLPGFLLSDQFLEVLKAYTE